MTLTKVKLERFTAFDSLDLPLSPGINVLVGANGTGKTHLMKVCYAACDVAKSRESFPSKLVRVFLPSDRALGRLVKRQIGNSTAVAEVHRADRNISVSFPDHPELSSSAISREIGWADSSLGSVYIPVKEMLSNAPGFRSLYAAREVHFEEVYADILDRAYLPALRGPVDEPRRRLLDALQKAVDGKVLIKNEEFFLRTQHGEFEFSLLAEGMRKLALLWLLIRNGSLLSGSVLFWDEPETNLNPKLYGVLMDVLLELQRLGVQVFLATHDYVILEELNLRKKEQDAVAFHSLHHDKETGEIACNTASNYLDIHPNAIAEAFDDLYDREIERSLGSLVK